MKRKKFFRNQMYASRILVGTMGSVVNPKEEFYANVFLGSRVLFANFQPPTCVLVEWFNAYRDIVPKSMATQLFTSSSFRLSRSIQQQCICPVGRHGNLCELEDEIQPHIKGISFNGKSSFLYIHHIRVK
jgi:hypothetical protein